MRMAGVIGMVLGVMCAQAWAQVEREEGPAKGAPVTWETAGARLDQETAEGFSGAVVLVRDGKVVLEKGYGHADRDAKILNTPRTVFGIGSTPIDFTKAGILLLAQRGKLKLSDPLTTYFKDVPEDKRGITLDHLMTGRSGLVNFHDLPGDAEPVHTWIDRDEAVRRIMATTLLFKPGEGNEHSHSAFGLLAAVIEIVSGKSYQDFVRSELFTPAGMKDTGFFGEPIPKERMAIGYGKKSGAADAPNAPPYWGKTSWLVMGSGGMVSTVVDLRRWVEALESGKIIDQASVRRSILGPGSVLAGGDMHGYEIIFAIGNDALMIIVTNNPDGPARGEKFEGLARDLAGLVTPPPAPYMIGVRFQVEGGKVQIGEAVPGGPGEAAGLRAGDVVVSVNGVPLGDQPIEVLRPWLKEGKPIEFEVLRGEERMKVTVVPRKR